MNTIANETYFVSYLKTITNATVPNSFAISLFYETLVISRKYLHFSKMGDKMGDSFNVLEY